MGEERKAEELSLLLLWIQFSGLSICNDNPRLSLSLVDLLFLFLLSIPSSTPILVRLSLTCCCCRCSQGALF